MKQVKPQIMESTLYPVWYQSESAKWKQGTQHHVQLRAWYCYHAEYGIAELCYFNLATFGSTGQHQDYELPHHAGKRVSLEIEPGSVNKIIERAQQLWETYAEQLLSDGLISISYYDRNGGVIYG
jgi:hypothetical protein